MLNPVQNIAFGGIYDLMVPNGTPREKINAKSIQTQQIIAKKIANGYNTFNVATFDDRIRIVSRTDDPNVIMNLFEAIGGKDLALQYMNRNRQEFRLNINA